MDTLRCPAQVVLEQRQSADGELSVSSTALEMT